MALDAASADLDGAERSTYDFPYGMPLLKRYYFFLTVKFVMIIFYELLFFRLKWTTYVPFLPTYKTKKN